MNIPALASESTYIEQRKYFHQATKVLNSVAELEQTTNSVEKSMKNSPGEENGLYLILIEYELALVLVKTRMIVKGSEHLRLDNSELGRVSHLRI